MNGDLCAGLSKCDSDCRAQAAGRSGYERDLVLQVELIEYQGNFPFRLEFICGHLRKRVRGSCDSLILPGERKCASKLE